MWQSWDEINHQKEIKHHTIFENKQFNIKHSPTFFSLSYQQHFLSIIRTLRTVWALRELSKLRKFKKLLFFSPGQVPLWEIHTSFLVAVVFFFVEFMMIIDLLTVDKITFNMTMKFSSSSLYDLLQFFNVSYLL